MPSAVLERAPTIDQMFDAYNTRYEESHVSLAKNILIVEDDPGIRDILTEILEEETIHRVILAPDAETALDILQTAKADILLCDYRLPGMNGLDLIDHIREKRAYQQTPIVLMSASLFWEDIGRSNVRYLRKPFDLDRLLQVVEDALNGR